ncbi:hypothetical protein COBT_001986 [Conglomerata obtusa]
MIILKLEKDAKKAYVEFISQREKIFETKNKLNEAEAKLNIDEKNKNEIQKKHEEISKNLGQTIEDRGKKLKEMGAEIDQAYSLHNVKLKELVKSNEALITLKNKYKKIKETNNPEFAKKVKVAEKNLKKVGSELDLARIKYEKLKNDTENTEINYDLKISQITEQLNKVEEEINLNLKKSEELHEQNNNFKKTLNVVVVKFKIQYHAARKILE